METVLLSLSPPLFTAVIRRGLENKADAWFVWLLVATVVLFLAVLAEEHSEQLVPLRYRIDESSGHVTSDPNRDTWRERAKKAALWLTVIAIIAEGLFEFLGARAESRVRTFNDEALTSAQTEAARANERSAEANERAVSAQANLGGALAKAESARALAKQYESQIADSSARVKEAEARAAEARSMAETDHLARVQLESSLKWRSLSTAQLGRISDKISVFDAVFDVVTYPSEGECLNFTNELFGMLKDKWTLDPNRKFQVLFGLVVGVKVQYSSGAIPTLQSSARALVSALKAEGVDADLDPIPDKDFQHPGVIEINVGKSPASMQPPIPLPK